MLVIVVVVVVINNYLVIYVYIHTYIHMRNLLGWLETRLARNALNYLDITKHTLKSDNT